MEATDLQGAQNRHFAVDAVVLLRHDVRMDAVSQVRASLAAGDTPDKVARSLVVDQRLSPIEAIKALRAGGNMHLGDAKAVVHRNLPPEQQAAAERLWDEAIAALEHRVD
ncbi:MAG: hypothetical protein ACRD6W_03000 [Nitrososphaerales archaeon]